MGIRPWNNFGISFIWSILNSTLLQLGVQSWSYKNNHVQVLVKTVKFCLALSANECFNPIGFNIVVSQMYTLKLSKH